MQKFTTSVLLAYSAENEAQIQQISNDLDAVLDFKYAKIERDQEESLTALCKGFDGPVLLFITDNFLRSTKCMQDGLKMLNEHKDQLLPVVMPGFRIQEDGSTEEVETSFERVSDIIQYINFWQDRYLDLRRQKREDASLSTPGFEEHLKVVRSISGEAGEYLRLLRSMEHLELSEFQKNRYEFLFEFLDAEIIGEQLHDLPEFGSSAEPEVEEEVEDEATAPSEAAFESAIEAAPAEDEDEEPPVDLTSIPGMGMLTPSPEAEAPAPEVEEEPVAFELTGQPDEASHITPELSEEQEDEDEEDDELELAEVEIPATKEIEAPEEDSTNEAALNHLVEKAWRMADGGDLATAATLLSAGLDEYPQSETLQYNYALLLAQQDEISGAKQVIDDLLTRNPQHEQGLYLAAELADIEGKSGLAQKYLTRLVRLNDQGAEVWYKLGVLSLEKDPPKYKQAERYLKEAVKRDECPAEAHYELGLLYSNHFGKPKKALKHFQRVREAQPDHAFVNYDIALLLHQKGKQKKALEAYEQAVAINPEIKTPENDAAFALSDQAVERKQEQHTLQALKDNVERLEALIQQRDEQQEQPAPKKLGSSKTVLITGATSGIGRATAEKYAANGYRLIITGRRQERLEELQSAWEEAYGIEVHTLNFDVRDAAAVEATIAALPEEWFDIDILINNAGKAKGFDPIHEGQLEHWEEMIDTNLKGLLYLTRTVSPRMVARGTGHIINVASTAGKEVYPNGNVYCATKHAVDALTKAMRLDLHQHGVRVSQVAPAHVEETEFALVRFDGDAERAKIYNDFKPLTSSDVAETIYFISQQPAHVNILDVVLQGTQQANSTTIDRSGRERYEEEE